MNISQNCTTMRQIMEQEEKNAHRKPGSVLLLAVSKQQSAEAITEVFNQGINHFGENYYQEALEKMEQLASLPICWHFIGPIQSNKTKGIALHFDWVHSIDRIKIAQLLNAHRPEDKPPQNICLQINLMHEENKSGVSEEAASELAFALSQLPKLKLKGLMTIPPPQNNAEEQYQLFLRLNKLMHSLNKEFNLDMDTLSMGMSDDLVPAIKAGATIVRIGRALFGERQGTNK